MTKEEIKHILSEIIEEKYEPLKILVEKILKKNHLPEKMIFTLNEAAEYLSLSKHTVRKYARSGKIKRAFEDIRDYRFHRTELDRFVLGYRNM
jgi:excisionase family DNA binding protein